MVLFVLISIAWLAVVFFGLAMCRLARRSDDSDVAALAERISAAREIEAMARASEHAKFDLYRGRHRATG